jgi:capsular polysaccharide transport system permease protein
MKPKAKKFRVRQSPSGDQKPGTASQSDKVNAQPDKPRKQMQKNAGQIPAQSQIAAIKQEGLTERQLRMAKRVAQRNGLSPKSGFDAVRLLRERGIDPFSRGTMLALVSDDQDQSSQAKGRAQLPQTVPNPDNTLPTAEVISEQSPAERRAADILRIQKDIAKRRRRNLAALTARLAVFIFLPTAMVGWYYANVATPMYATHSEFIIQKSEGSGAGGGLSSMFSGTQLATNQDSIAVQSYLESRAAMLRLAEDHNFKQHFSTNNVDFVQGLDPAASNEEAYRLYKKHVKLGYDPTEGVIKMEVIAADPITSQRFSEALIGYAEQQVDELTQRLREDQMRGARESFREAEIKREEARNELLRIQTEVAILDPVSEAGGLMGQITALETQLTEKQILLQAQLENRRPNEARVQALQGDIRRLETFIADLRTGLTDQANGEESLAAKTAQLRMAEADFQTRELMLQQTLQSLETAQTEANRQVRYLSTGVPPIAPDKPTYPRALENTLVAFLIFSGIYLIMSLTVSVLREQVS